MSRRDPESLERENDRNLETMGDRVSMLKNITMDIHKEADSHHRIFRRDERRYEWIPRGAESNRPTVFEGFRDEKWEVLLLLVRVFYRHVAFEQDYFCINKEEKEKD